MRVVGRRSPGAPVPSGPAVTLAAGASPCAGRRGPGTTGCWMQPSHTHKGGGPAAGRRCTPSRHPATRQLPLLCPLCLCVHRARHRRPNAGRLVLAKAHEQPLAAGDVVAPPNLRARQHGARPACAAAGPAVAAAAGRAAGAAPRQHLQQSLLCRLAALLRRRPVCMRLRQPHLPARGQVWAAGRAVWVVGGWAALDAAAGARTRAHRHGQAILRSVVAAAHRDPGQAGRGGGQGRVLSKEAPHPAQPACGWRRGQRRREGAAADWAAPAAVRAHRRLSGGMAGQGDACAAGAAGAGAHAPSMFPGSSVSQPLPSCTTASKRCPAS